MTLIIGIDRTRRRTWRSTDASPSQTQRHAALVVGALERVPPTRRLRHGEPERARHHRRWRRATRWAADGHHLISWRAGYLILVDVDQNTSPIPIAGPADPGAFFGTPSNTTFEDYAYIVPGDDCWEVTAWAH
jgi:hypothetical protein